MGSIRENDLHGGVEISGSTATLILIPETWKRLFNCFNSSLMTLFTEHKIPTTSSVSY